MSEIDRTIDMASRDLMLARLGLRPEEIPNLIARLTELRQERWRQFSEGLEGDRKFYEAHKPKPKPPTLPDWYRVMSCDDWIGPNRTLYTQNCEIHPDI